MDRWNGKVAIVTGASAGIGIAIVKALVKHGVKVVGLARRMEKLQELSKDLEKSLFHPIQCDVTKEEDILNAFKWTESNLGGVDILINNAGVVCPGMIIDMPTSEYRKTIDTNLIAPAICSREAIQSMRKRNAPGHVININSVAGHYAESIHMPLSMYSASKYGLTALCVELRHEIVLAKLNVKVTSISPGAVRTEMVTNLMKDSVDWSNVPMLEIDDIAQAVVYALGTPQQTEIPEITLLRQGQAIGTPRHTELLN